MLFTATDRQKEKLITVSKPEEGGEKVLRVFPHESRNIRLHFKKKKNAPRLKNSQILAFVFHQYKS